ncbi:hypothetical protein RSOLAG1IB_04882 [Rhizoctonia solani AG-1 IB]|uniref:PPPDE domain-containing protein n=1 Tax=Thanatephorus cucumeris (strain AG1-IB / isolate 7/3/14) TaxID=1108050 RepID=A0A0B7FX61_THACB|nr:hypothetical protein RSOLAG1IB_04882 [Rhizoctonia solani AG-1 IB]
MPELLRRRRSLMGYVLRPLVCQLVSAGRLSFPSTNRFIASSPRTQSRFILDFHSDKGRADVQNWYKYQGRNTRFTLLEYRKDIYGRVRHEFIVVRLDDTTLCRFDRRVRDEERGYALRDEGVPAEDSAHVLSSFETEYKELMARTEVLLSIELPQGEDLSFILAVCEGIQTHAKAAAYNLMRYNCYFFSWMVVAAVARRTYNWESVVLSRQGWDDIIRTSLTPGQHNETQLTSSQHPGVRLQFGRIAFRLNTQSQKNLNSLTDTNYSTTPIGTFRGALISRFSESHGTIQKVLPNLLLRSQLGCVLKRELCRIQSSSFFLARCTVAENRIRNKWPFDIGFAYRYDLKALKKASLCAAGIFATNANAEDKATKDLLRELESTWKHALRAFMAPGFKLQPIWSFDDDNDEDEDPDGDFVFISTKEAADWEDGSRMITKEWESAWDECDTLVAQYAETATSTIMAMILERLTDVLPEQLRFGDGVKVSHCIFD